jgi:hypothetical protein
MQMQAARARQRPEMLSGAAASSDPPYPPRADRFPADKHAHRSPASIAGQRLPRRPPRHAVSGEVGEGEEDDDERGAML